MQTDFEHIQSAHCENGVIVKLLRASGVDLVNEPMAFGIGSGLFYIHLPFLKLNNAPAITFRTMPGRIFKQTCSFLDIDYASKRFSSQRKAEAYLDQLLNRNINVGCQVGVFNLSYLPVEYRFHFNAHNIVVFGKKGDMYQISDTVMESPTELSSAELLKSRFAKGLYAPKGHLYYIKNGQSTSVDKVKLKKAVVKGIKRNVRDMLYVPGSFAGVSGIRYTANKIKTWRDGLGIRKAGRYLGHIVRMQEEIGTGGGGFRFLYAAFLQEASELFQEPVLATASDEFSQAGDLWRQSAVLMAGVFKGRNTEQSHFNEIAEVMYEISDIEKRAFTRLSKLKPVAGNE
ncbi:MAG: BtrH N-terminal domain-containing protein [Breznakibacter sp.]